MQIYHLSNFGIEKIFWLNSKKYYYKGMFADVTKFVNYCTRGLAVKDQRIPKVPFLNSFIPTRPEEFLSLDFVDPFKNKMYIICHRSYLKVYSVISIS